MPRMSDDELLRRACLYAERDQEAFVEAYAHMLNDPAAKKAISFLRQLRAYRLKRWGRTKLEKLMGEADSVPIGKITGRK